MPRVKSVKWCSLGLFMFVTLWLTHPTNAQKALSDFKNYEPINEQLHTCGRVQETDLASLKAAGINTVISLSTDSPSEIKAMKQSAGEQGMTVVHIPVSWKAPSIESLEDFFEAMDQHQSSHLLVHCRINWRASAFVYLYRTIRLKETPAEAKEPLLAVWNPWKNKTWAGFMLKANLHFATKKQ